MQDATIENVRPLLASQHADGSTVQCIFRCPVSGDTFEASGQMIRSPESTNSVQSSMKRGLKYGMGRALNRVMRNVFGYNPLANIATDAARQAVNNVKTYSDFTENERNEAILRAFHKVAHRFVWDPKRSAWVSRSSHDQMATEFEKRLQRHPITDKFDAEVLARILVEMSNVDGTMSEEEKALLADFLPPHLSLNEMLAKPSLSEAELLETSAGPVRENMIMLAWAMLFADYSVDPAEMRFLKGLASKMGLGTGAEDSMKEHAQEFTLVQLWESVFEGEMTREQAFAKSDGLGVERLTAERLEIRYRKARG
ncbi:TerB family tellurite resistance protein [Sulfidibacter corallicola]|uniref:TerB family tellurite resistance protein n=1 Tax=Sulfidibacter corallicola TaxID=2818388 RepID=A0A8A4TUK4_SULCO|nr:TerB family tellurite resistance protein [Sulfidibacter corallicola]QTD52814.1 TerB family tellurite resistance protein [Sulfidibacter corallicola]